MATDEVEAIPRRPSPQNEREDVPLKAHTAVIDNARSAADKERSMTLLQGLRLYPKAVAWSMLISTCIVMEGYDICLINNFCRSYTIYPIGMRALG